MNRCDICARPVPADITRCRGCRKRQLRERIGYGVCLDCRGEAPNGLDYCDPCMTRRLAPRDARRAAQEAAAEASRRASRYRCPEHPERGVTWRGKGCPDCRAHRDRRRTERRQRRLAEAS